MDSKDYKSRTRNIDLQETKYEQAKGGNSLSRCRVMVDDGTELPFYIDSTNLRLVTLITDAEAEGVLHPPRGRET
jgi:hypothetical protein